MVAFGTPVCFYIYSFGGDAWGVGVVVLFVGSDECVFFLVDWFVAVFAASV